MTKKIALVIILLLLLMTGCGQNASKQKESGTGSTPSALYKGISCDWGEVEGVINSITRVDHTLYAGVYKKGTPVSEGRYTVLGYDTEKNELEKTVLNGEEERVMWALTAKQDSFLGLFLTLGENNKGFSTLNLCTFDKEGNLTENKDILSAISGIEETIGLNSFFLSDLGEVYFYTVSSSTSSMSSKMYCITQDKTLKEFDEVFGEIIGVGQCDSQVYASIERSGKVTIFNVTENKEVADINVTVTAPAAKMVNSTEKDHMTVVIDSAAYKVGIKNGNVEQILKGNDISGLADDANVDRMIEVLGTTDLYALVTLGKTVDGKRHYELMRITKGDGDTVSGDQQDEREEIRIAVTEKTPILTDLVYQFNQENKEFRMTVEVYDSEDGKNHILTDLSTGKVPDIIATDLIELDVLVQRQIVGDLNEMLETDETLSKDSFVGKALEIFERDGKIYALPSRLGVSGLSGKQSMLKDLDGKTLEEFRRFASENTNACAGVSKENMLRCIMELNLSAFLDEGMKECNFDNADFCNILNYVNMYQNQEMVITSLSDFEEKVKMQEVIMYPVLLTDPVSYQFYEALWGKDICFIGYPSTDGNGIQLCSLGESYMITRNSAHKKEAWELLKSIVMDHSLMDSGMPAYKELFEECLENAAEKKMEDDGTGNLIEVPKYTYYFDDVELELNALSKEDVNGLRGLLEKATPVKQSSKVISDIILEETKAFFDGTTSAENVAKIIQNRAQNYLNEQ